MAPESTNNPRPPLPDWAEKVTTAIGSALVAGDGHLTDAEQTLLTDVHLLLRARLGGSCVTEQDARRVAATELRGILRRFDEQEGAAL